MMDGYFNQDYDLYGDTDQAIVQAYAGDIDAGTIDATIAEIDAWLASPTIGLLERYRDATGRTNISIGETDAAAREWLAMVGRVLADARPARGG